MEKYKICRKIGEGSFSEVFSAKISTSSSLDMVAIKRLYPLCRDKPNSASSIPKEVSILKTLNPHPQILKFIESFYDTISKRHHIVTELMEFNLYDYIQQVHRGQPLPEYLVKVLVWQLLTALAHLHRHEYFHRDVKPENLLLSTSHDRDFPFLKLADFGGSQLIRRPPPYTDYIATRWYRAPECLATNGYYTFKVDLWSVGCVMFELLAGRPLFPGRNEFLQIQCIERLLGIFHMLPQLSLSSIREIYTAIDYTRPLPRYNTAKSTKYESDDKISGSKTSCSPLTHQSTISGTLSKLQEALPHCSQDCLHLLSCLLSVNPVLRISAATALKFTFFSHFQSPFYKCLLCYVCTPRNFTKKLLRPDDRKVRHEGEEEKQRHSSEGFQSFYQESYQTRQKSSTFFNEKRSNLNYCTKVQQENSKRSQNGSCISEMIRSPSTKKKRYPSSRFISLYSSCQDKNRSAPHSFLETQTTALTETSSYDNDFQDLRRISSFDHNESFHDHISEEHSLTSAEIQLFLDTLKTQYQENVPGHHHSTRSRNLFHYLKRFSLYGFRELKKISRRCIKSIRYYAF